MIIRATGPFFLAIMFSHKKAQNAQKENLSLSLSRCFCALCAFLWRHLLMKSVAPGITRSPPEIFFDAQQLIVLCDAIRPRKRSGFDLSRVRADREIRDER